ncbi:MAG: NAD(P)/FAD-dependent oxidoreductase [Bacteroidota bacterium]|nr:NAD(P)/FAD-dependent oxidoreductase [Bacteroidota bacterium]
MQRQQLIVIGGGAAGFFCAINAALKNPDLEVTIIEKTSKLLSKVRVSGGGRCNVTHACFSIAEMIKKYPRGTNFLKQAFHHFFSTDTIQWFKERSIELKTESDGRMFPSTDSSETIINCFLREAEHLNIKIIMNCEVMELKDGAKDTIDAYGNSQKQFLLNCKDGRNIQSDFICVACGGYHKKEYFNWLVKLGHSFALPVPSLFTFNIPGDPIVELMGISVNEVVVKLNDSKLLHAGPLLITHWGLSGPAVLKLSAFAARILAERKYDFAITINWLPQFNANSILEKLKSLRFDLASKKIGNRNPFNLPSRLWQYHLQRCGINEDIRWSDLPARFQNLLGIQLCSQQFHVKGKTTFKEEFVTAGGINLNEVNAATMESKIVKNLFFAGEILDVDGITGGFNFQHAWTSGFVAAKSIASLQ